MHHLSWMLEFGTLLMMQSAAAEADLTSVSALSPICRLSHLKQDLGAVNHPRALSSSRTNTQTRANCLNGKTAPLLLSWLSSADSCVMRNCAQQAIVDKKPFGCLLNPFVFFTIKSKADFLLSPSLYGVFFCFFFYPKLGFPYDESVSAVVSYWWLTQRRSDLMLSKSMNRFKTPVKWFIHV